LQGTLPIEATAPDGGVLSVGVWRWPFDPVLVDLTTMVTPHLAEEQLREIVGTELDLEVVAYRPTERAVIRVRGSVREIYVKIVPPVAVDALVRRHVALSDAGVPVPRTLASGNGWIAMEAIAGTTLRDRMKHGIRPLPSPERYRDLLTALSAVRLDDVAPVRSRVDDAPHHAAMLAAVLPDARDRLATIVERLSVPRATRSVGTVHGDLHEAQLVVDDSAVIGLLDVDDVGDGDPLDDVATLIGHLRFRAATGGDPAIEYYADNIRSAVAGGHDPADVDLHIAAVLVGLATGPFRIQQPDWKATTARLLDLVEQHLDVVDPSIDTSTDIATRAPVP
jgi:hypothetical protein